MQNEISQKEKNTDPILMHIYGLQKGSIDECICRTAVEVQTWRTDLLTWWGKQRVGRIERVAQKHIYYWMQNRQAVGNGCHSVTTYGGEVGWSMYFFEFSFVWLYAQEWDCWIIQQLCLQFFAKPPCFLQLHQRTLPPTVQEGSLFSTPSPGFICRLFNDGHSDWYEVIPHCSFDLYFSNVQQC